MKRQSQHAYAVVRVETPGSEASTWTNRITVKEILPTEDEAKAEVDRLNKLNADKGCLYFYQITRLVGLPTSNPPQSEPFSVSQKRQFGRDSSQS